jgi:cyclin B
MTIQPHINVTMRSEVIDWLVDKHLRFLLHDESLYLAVNIVDRFLERKVVSEKKLPLLAITSLLIAAKFDHQQPTQPTVRSLLFVAAYCRSEIVTMEGLILTSLDYRIFVPTAHNFLKRYLKAARISTNSEPGRIARYILECTLMWSDLLRYLPSQLASAAICIARYSVGKYPWSPTLLKHTGYCEEEILPIAHAIRRERERSLTCTTAIDEKYGFSRRP